MSAEVKREVEAGQPPRTTKLSSKNQVTLPVALMAMAHVKPGDVFRVEVVGDGEFRLTRYEDPFWHAFNELAGSMPGLAATADLEELRNEWER